MVVSDPSASVRRMMSRWRVAIGLASVAVLSGCSGGDGDSAEESPVPQQSSEREDAQQLLSEEGYLDDAGNVAFGPAGPRSEETAVNEALCTYLFGSPQEVAERAGLAGTVLAPGSGYQMLGANGSGVRCGWGTQDEPVFALVVWGADAEWITEDEDTFEVVIELPENSVGVAAYDPESDVERLPATELEAWLREAPEVNQSV